MSAWPIPLRYFLELIAFGGARLRTAGLATMATGEGFITPFLAFQFFYVGTTCCILYNVTTHW